LGRLLAQRFDDFGSWTSFSEIERVTREDGQIEIRFEFRRGTEQGEGHISVGPPPPTTEAARLALIRRQFGEELIARYRWSFEAAEEEVGGGQRRLTLTAQGRRTVLRIQRDLTEPDPARPGQRRIAHPPVTDLRYFGVELPPGVP
jgi:hypothetical protein